MRTYSIAAMVLIVACGPGVGGEGGSSETSETGGGTSTSGGETGGSTEAPTSGVSSSEATTSEATTTEGATSGETTDGTTGPLMCTAPPLTEEQVAALGFGVFGNEFEAQPGDQRVLRLGVVECCYVLQEIDACVEYSLSPAEGASYDPESGLLTIEDSAAAGTVYTLTADVESGRAIVEAKIVVYTPESHPLVGIWHEVAQSPCDDGPDIAPMPILQELWFKANGDVMVTWQPFEIYVDYWGTYTFDVETGALEIMVDGGNYVPPDVDGAGTFAVVGDALTLQDMWLGSAQDFMGVPACGHTFMR